MSVTPQIACDLVSYGTHIMPGMFTDETPLFHYPLSDCLMDTKVEKTLVMAPRGTAKSSLGAEVFPMWHIFEEDFHRYRIGESTINERKPKYVVIVSKTQREAKERLATIKNVLGNGDQYSEAFRKAYGDWGERTAVTWREDFIVLKNGSAIRAVGTGQPVRGMKRGYQRPTLIAGDDLEDELNTRTAEAMDHNMRWLQQAIIPSLAPSGRVVIIGTPINTECMVAKLFGSLGWNSLIFEQDAELDLSRWWNDETKEWDEYDDVLWPQRVTRKKLLQLKAEARELGLLSSYYRERECKIIGDETQIFAPGYDRYWEGELRRDASQKPYLHVTALDNGHGHLKELKEPRRIPVLVFTGVDPASTVSRTADKTAIINIAVDKDENIYHLPYIHKRMFPVEIPEAIAENHKRFQPFRGMVEIVGAFAFIEDYLWKDYRIRYVPDKPRDKKKGEGSRLERLHKHASRGKIFFQPDMIDLQSQHHHYPNGKDDLMDAEEKAVRIMTIPFHEFREAGLDAFETGRGRTFDPMLA